MFAKNIFANMFFMALHALEPPSNPHHTWVHVRARASHEEHVIVTGVQKGAAFDELDRRNGAGLLRRDDLAKQY